MDRDGRKISGTLVDTNPMDDRLRIDTVDAQGRVTQKRASFYNLLYVEIAPKPAPAALPTKPPPSIYDTQVFTSGP
jgi:hypothetical protein